MNQGLHKNIKQHNNDNKIFLIIKRKMLILFPNKHIRIISDGSCDTEE